MKRVLLTGASGFIGRHCLLPLQAAGYEIHAVFSSHSLAEEYPQVNWHRANLLDGDKVHTLVTQIKPSHLLHLAWDVTPGKYWTSPHNLQWVQAGLDLLQAFVENDGQRVVMAGSCAEYDWNYGYCSENITPLAPTTFYGTCKHALQTVAMAFAQQSNISFAWGRLFYLFGPFEYPTRLVPAVLCSLLANKVALCSPGNQIRDFLYVQDVANALIALLNSAVTGPVNIASGQPVKVKEIVEILATQLDRPELVRLGALPAPSNEPHLLVADVRRLSQQVGWKPQYNLETGLANTIEWWSAHQSEG